MGSTYAFPRPALAVDCVIFGFGEGGLEVLLVERALDPPGWALPGGFVRLGESVDAAARRELAEEAGVEPAYLEQLHTFGDVDRDPRERVVSVAYFGLVRRDRHLPRAATDARSARWTEVSALPALAFDHARIVAVALQRLRSKVTWQPVGFDLLPATFTLTELQNLYEVVLGRAIDKRNFRKKVLTMGLLEDTQEQTTGGRHRPARLYRFDRSAYDRLSRDGFEFRLG
jgi:8-oxo-dGTP diphosphatase